MADAGDLLFPGGVPLDQAVPGHLPAEGLAEPGIGKVGANKVDGRAPAAQINGQAGLMLAGARQGHPVLGVLPGLGGGKTLLEQEGIEVPNENWTWSTMEQIVDQITKDKNGDGVIDQFGTYNYTWKEAVYSNGAELFDKDGKKAFFSGTKVNEAVKFVKKLNEMNGGREVTQNDFDSGNVAFMPLAFSEYRTYKTYPYKIKKYTSFQWDCTSMPAGPGGHNTSEVDALLMTIGNKSKHKELAWEFLKMLTSDSSIQREIFEYSQGASVLKYVTGSRYAESMIRKDMDVDEKGIDNRLLSDAIENGRINPKFSKYPEAMALAENEIDDIYKNEKNIDSSLKVFQRSITKFLNQ